LGEKFFPLHCSFRIPDALTALWHEEFSFIHLYVKFSLILYHVLDSVLDAVKNPGCIREAHPPSGMLYCAFVKMRQFYTYGYEKSFKIDCCIFFNNNEQNGVDHLYHLCYRERGREGGVWRQKEA
jgi:hypothetical protein